MSPTVFEINEDKIHKDKCCGDNVLSSYVKEKM